LARPCSCASIRATSRLWRISSHVQPFAALTNQRRCRRFLPPPPRPANRPRRPGKPKRLADLADEEVVVNEQPRLRGGERQAPEAGTAQPEIAHLLELCLD